mmetsp:Transcript_80462/g.117958  ORF Transcript_80462/g.117958 Transcript_80462/m.117958 type:complete len:201 (-) Transcript_80462:537-1139(-)|eukprot:CAMPEP_0179437352 /NCGR_PEP_ID=MMETSP0799-20121207/21259_1 /TAXON_ID=46947 /ORGANISM="Geminigera cryophila, Strain CCMP2564" /LENGTH=200 /DNA_ID=CAMNT_0021218231 /DNA_START=29 /DNA_END=631 /DNA_ORIENTATION=+
MASTEQGGPRDYGALDDSKSKEAYARAGGAKLVDHPLYQKPQLRTKMRSVIPRLLGLCCILVVVMMGCGYVMYSQLAAGYVQIKPGTAHFSTVAKMAQAQQDQEDGITVHASTAGVPARGRTPTKKANKINLKNIFKSDLHQHPKDSRVFNQWCDRLSAEAKTRWCPPKGENILDDTSEKQFRKYKRYETKVHTEISHLV